MKICSKCQETKDFEDFYKNIKSKDGLKTQCKKCCNFHQRTYYKKHTEKAKEMTKIWKLKNPEKLKEWQNNNKEKLLESTKKWQNKNREKIRNYNNNKYKTNENYRLSAICRSRILDALKNLKGKKCDTTINLIGCSINKLKEHLEGTKVPWKDYTRKDIDHIKPCSSFDLKDPEQQRECFHYTNLQYLPSSENRSKGAKILETVVVKGD